MRKLFVIAGACISIFFSGCGNGENKADYNYDEAGNNKTADTIYNTAYQLKSKPIDKKFAHTASLKAMVNDVASATYQIESVTKSVGGFVRSSKLNTQILTEETVQVSADSAKNNASKRISCDMELRVPHQLLDSLLKAINTTATNFDYRIVETEDISLSLQENILKEKRLTVSQNRLANAVQEKGKKMSEVSNVENTLFDKQIEKDNALLESLANNDKVAYSTIKLELYQQPVFTSTMTAFYKPVEPYQLGFGRRMINSFLVGWDIVLDILVGITKIWWLLLILLISLPYIRAYKLNINTKKISNQRR
ncbi:MAG: DUF4349 domain-containing protein [Sediminibacterium sp.]|jgi:hypothetical protein|nr:DUF4349 domain-containing protein [Chitinophagaceae bacterium]